MFESITHDEKQCSAVRQLPGTAATVSECRGRRHEWHACGAAVFAEHGWLPQSTGFGQTGQQGNGWLK